MPPRADKKLETYKFTQCVHIGLDCLGVSQSLLRNGMLQHLVNQVARLLLILAVAFDVITAESK